MYIHQNFSCLFVEVKLSLRVFKSCAQHSRRDRRKVEFGVGVRCAFVGVLNARVVYAGVTIKLILSVRIRKPILTP